MQNCLSKDLKNAVCFRPMLMGLKQNISDFLFVLPKKERDAYGPKCKNFWSMLLRSQRAAWINHHFNLHFKNEKAFLILL